MSDLLKAAQQALEALEFLETYYATERDTRQDAIAALRAALAEPVVNQQLTTEPVQPVAWIHPQYGHMQARTETMSPEVVASYERGGWTPLYTASPQRKPRHVSYVCPQCNWSLEGQE